MKIGDKRTKNEKKHEKVQYTIRFPPTSQKILDKLAEEEGVTKADIIRRALSFYIQTKEKTMEINGKILIVNDKGEKISEVVPWW